MLKSLGYETKPSKNFNCIKRNIQFAVACAEGAKGRLPAALQNLIGDMLPVDVGMVRICSDPQVTSPKMNSLSKVGTSTFQLPPFLTQNQSGLDLHYFQIQ